MSFKYKVVYDSGKPYSEVYNNIEELYEGLEKFYRDNKTDDYPFTVDIYDSKGNDISESFIMKGMITEIINQ